MTLTRRELLRSVIRSPQITPAPVAADATPDSLFRPLMRAPQIDPRYWALSIGGLVKHPLTFTYDELLAMPAVDLPCTMLCASNPPGGERIGHVVWRGVAIRELMSGLDIAGGMMFARLQGFDGYRTSIDWKQLELGLLAYAVNGEPLTPEQGFPARLIIPGLYDHKSPRWIQRVEFDHEPIVDTWAERGYTEHGVILGATVGITSPRPFETVGTSVSLEGYAFAGYHNIGKIELSIDDGPWMPITFEPAPRFQWVRWATEWSAPGRGDYQITALAMARAVAGKDGWPTHSVVVRVR